MSVVLIVLAGLAVLILGGGIGAAVYLANDEGDGEASGRRASPPTTASSTGSPPTTQDTSDEPDYITEIKAQVSAIRGLPWRSELTVNIVSKEELSGRVREVVARDAHPDRIAGDGATLKLLHAIPKDLDFAKAIDDLLAEQVLGFYDPITKALVVANPDAGDAEVSANTKVSIAHELNHALTDQHFDFGAATDALDDNDRGEELIAYSGLIEGDAVALQFAWAERHLSEEEQVEVLFGSLAGGDTSVLERTPEFIRESLLFPYTEGVNFVEEISDGEGFDDIDRAYRRPPTSTEQILHPELYAAGESSAAPDLPDVAAATGCEALRRNTVGEFAMAEILSDEIGESEAARAAEGWSGDVFQTVRCGGSLGMVVRWRADGDGDAAQLMEALSGWTAGWSRSERTGAHASSTRNGSLVELILAEDSATGQRLAAAVGALN